MAKQKDFLGIADSAWAVLGVLALGALIVMAFLINSVSDIL